MILFVYGTRPEALKLAPVVKACRALGLSVQRACMDQSPELLKGLGLGCPAWYKGTPALVVVQGDTRTAFEAAVRWFEEGVPVFHVEAGVRSGDLASPWPEEGYRRMISQIATYHAATTNHNRMNLIAESPALLVDPQIPEIRVTGSPVVESVRERCGEQPAARLGNVIVTLHRRENRGRFRQMMDAIGRIFDPRIVSWYSHPNHWAVEECVGLPIVPLPPRDSVGFAKALGSASLVITDSGGVVEEASALQTASLQARTVTDRPECLGKGSWLWDGTLESLVQLTGEATAMNYSRTGFDPNIFGDGTASQQIAAWLQSILDK